MKECQIAVLDDYQNAALESADWSALGHRADITVFKDHLVDPEAVIERLLPFDVIYVARANRRRTSFDQRVEEKANRRRGDRRIRC